MFGSTDGTTWTTRNSGVSSYENPLWAVTYGNNTFVVVGTKVILTSPDGTTWTKYSTSIDLQDVIYIE